MLLRRPSGDFLMQRRDDGKGKKIMYPNAWVFPGGVKEPDEDYLDTVVREAKEEFNLTLNPYDCEKVTVFNYDESADTHVYLCALDQDSVPSLNEGEQFEWMYLDDIEKMQLGFRQNSLIPTIREKIS